MQLAEKDEPNTLPVAQIDPVTAEIPFYKDFIRSVSRKCTQFENLNLKKRCSGVTKSHFIRLPKPVSLLEAGRFRLR